MLPCCHADGAASTGMIEATEPAVMAASGKGRTLGNHHRQEAKIIHDRIGAVPWWSTVRAVSDALGIRERHIVPVGCELGTAAFRESKRAAQIANVGRRARPLRIDTVQRLEKLFPRLDLTKVRVRTRCRLPPNRFRQRGSIYAMTFGNTIYWRDELDEDDPRELVKLIHELVHVDQVRRHGGETQFACAYGTGYLDGGGRLPGYINEPSRYHLNPLEAEAYSFESQFRDRQGRARPESLPTATGST